MQTAQQFNQNLRKQIRNRQKQQYFRKVRNQFHKQLASNRNQQQRMSQGTTISPSQQSVYNGKDPQSIKYMCCQLNKNNVKIVAKMLQNNVHIDLLQNLKTGTLVEPTLSLLVQLFSKQTIKVANKFVRIGLLDQLMRYTQQGSIHVGMCINITINIITQNIQYAQCILQARMHRHLIQLLQKTILSRQNNNEEQIQLGGQIMSAIARLCDVESKEYKQQFIQILSIALEMYKRRLYQKTIIQIIFQVGYQFREQTKYMATWVLDNLVNQASPEYSHLKSLLITVKLLSPLQINYHKISMLLTTIAPNLAQYAIRILQRIVDTNVQAIPRDMMWWQRVYLKLNKQQCKQVYVILLRKAKIRGEWVFNLVKQILQNYYMNITLINQTLIYVNSMIEGCKDGEERKRNKFYIKASGIQVQLARLYEHKNHQISRRSQYLLAAINSDI